MPALPLNNAALDNGPDAADMLEEMVQGDYLLTFNEECNEGGNNNNSSNNSRPNNINNRRNNKNNDDNPNSSEKPNNISENSRSIQPQSPVASGSTKRTHSKSVNGICDPMQQPTDQYPLMIPYLNEA